MLLHTQTLETGYLLNKNKKVLSKDASIFVEEGKLIALIGANGSGKSTLLRTLAGLQKPLSGEIFYEGIPLANISLPDLAKKRAFVGNEALRLGYIRAGEFIRLGSFPYRKLLSKSSNDEHEIYERALATSKAHHLVDRWFHELSDGEKQKVLIARALAQNTPLLLMDEPTSHLDAIRRVEIMELLKHMVSQTAKSIIFSTHELSLALNLADKILLLFPNNRVIKVETTQLLEDKLLDKVFPHADYVFDPQQLTFMKRT